MSSRRHRVDLRVALSAALALLACLPAVPAQPASEIEAAFDELRFERARRLLNAASDDQPQVLYFKARLAIWDHATRRAIDLAARCLEVGPRASICHEVWGEAISLELLDSALLQRYGLARRARSAWERAVELDPDNLRARMLLLRYYRQAPWIAGGSKRKASLQAQEIAARDPSRAAEAEGLMAYFDGDYEQALARFRKARQSSKHGFDARYYVPLAAARMGDHATAIRAFARLIQINPEEWEGWFFLGYAKLDARAPIEVTRTALRSACNGIESSALCARALYAHGAMLSRIGEKDAAREAFAAASSMDAGLAEARRALAELER